MDRGKRFVAYAFSVGDVFIELDDDLCILEVDGPLAWLGIGDAGEVAGRSLDCLLDRRDASLLRAATAMLRKSGRVGPLRVSLGAVPESRRPLGVFLSRLPGEDGKLHLVGISALRLYGSETPALPQLTDKASFLDRLPELLSSAAGGHLLISLVQIPTDADAGERAAFLQRLAVLTAQGPPPADLGGGRYAVIHHGEVGPEETGALLAALAEDSEIEVESTTLPPLGASPDTDTARAFVYAIRKFSDNETDFDLATINRSCAKHLKDTRERIVHLRAMLEHDRFKLAFQPIVCLANREIRHWEALVRFDIRGGSPFEMICFAEDVGLIAEFDIVILKKALQALRRTAKAGDPQSIAVNLSARSLVSPAFAGELESLLVKNRALAPCLLIEVTESAQVPDLGQLAGALAMIRALGYRVCLDDFGAGLSGFQYLRQLEVDIVKIDGSYVRGADASRESRAFLHAMVTLCHDLGIVTIGEWVETEAQAGLLQSLGVNCGQGFLFGHPAFRLPAGPSNLARAAQ